MSHETHTAPDQLPAEVEAALAALTRLSDAELWRIVLRSSAPEAAEQLTDLNDRRQREGLSDAQERLADELAGQLDVAMVMRAQAVALLHARGHDVSELVARA